MACQIPPVKTIQKYVDEIDEIYFDCVKRFE